MASCTVSSHPSVPLFDGVRNGPCPRRSAGADAGGLFPWMPRVLPCTEDAAATHDAEPESTEFESAGTDDDASDLAAEDPVEALGSADSCSMSRTSPSPPAEKVLEAPPELVASEAVSDVDFDSPQARRLGELFGGEIALACRALAVLPQPHASALLAMTEQCVHRGIDYASLGLNWDHPTTRTAYRRAAGASFSRPASLARQAASRQNMIELVNSILAAQDCNCVDGAQGEDKCSGCSHARATHEDLIVKAFCAEIGAPEAYATEASFEAVATALEAELLLPLRAFRESGDDLARTYSGHPVPRDLVQAKVDAITLNVLAGTYAQWRYENPVGRQQLAGLSAEQVALWREPTATRHSATLIVHEDAPGELGLFWATKIGGPSHGFDFEGQCLLPLLCNARHKVVLVSDSTAWPHHPCGRAHFRLLWLADTEPPRPVLWLEALNIDFAASAAEVNSRGWYEAVLAHAVLKAERMGVALSVDARLCRFLVEGLKVTGSVREVADRMVLRPSNGVLEASDYLSNKHDWVQLEEEVTAPLHRCLYEPLPRSVPQPVSPSSPLPRKSSASSSPCSSATMHSVGGTSP